MSQAVKKESSEMAARQKKEMMKSKIISNEKTSKIRHDDDWGSSKLKGEDGGQKEEVKQSFKQP